MAIWILLSIIAQFINAFVSLIDRYIVASGKVGRPIVVTFYISFFSALAILAFGFSWLDLPFGNFSFPSLSNVHLPSLNIIFISLMISWAFILGLYNLFSAFLLSEASDVVPVVSSFAAVSSLLFSFYLLESSLSGNFLWGFLFLVIGTFLIAKFRMSKRLLLLSVSAGLLFGLNSVLTKILFNETNFDNAFFWSRLFIALSALVLLLTPNFFNNKKNIVNKKSKKSGLILVVLNKGLAGLSGFLILKSIELGDVSVVQALSGLQFVFLILLAFLFGHKAPKCIGENCEIKDKIQKLVSVSIIVTGFSLLFI